MIVNERNELKIPAGMGWQQALPAKGSNSQLEILLELARQVGMDRDQFSDLWVKHSS